MRCLRVKQIFRAGTASTRYRISPPQPPTEPILFRSRAMSPSSSDGTSTAAYSGVEADDKPLSHTSCLSFVADGVDSLEATEQGCIDIVKS